jgi:alpha-D-xyloside xylohydrolase
VPLLISSAGYGVLWDNPSGTRVDLATAGSLTVSSDASSLIDYYFMAGPEPDDIIAQYRALTGAPPLFGRYAWGYWQSKEHYNTQSEFLDVVNQYRTRMLPIDGIVQDWFYWSPAPWGSHQFDAARYPDPTAMFTQAHTAHFHALLSVWARFDKTAFANHDALQAAGALVAPGLTDYTYYDPFKPEGRTIYWQQLRDQLFSKGTDAWWLDSTEPDLGGTWPTDTTAAGPGAFVANAYPLMTTSAVYQGQRAVTSDKRVFILTRSAYSGQQRNATVVWSGDINGDWATFKRQIPAGLNFSLSGIPYWNTDIGGFFPQLGGLANPQFVELYQRWFQFGAFCPMFRSHGQGGDRNMWSFGVPAQAVLLGVDQLRYRLLPYIYSLSWRVTHDGYSMMRPLVFDFRADARALNIPDQFMFGPALMVNPVTDPGVTTRSVYLPANTTWFDFWTGATSTGGAQVMASAPLDHLPLYVRAGSVLPLGPMMQYSTEMPPDPMELRVYPGADGAFTLYDDENDNYNYEKGMYATIPLTWNNATRTLTIGARQGAYPGMAGSRTFRLVVVGANHGVGTAVTAAADQTVSYTGAAVELKAP